MTPPPISQYHQVLFDYAVSGQLHYIYLNTPLGTRPFSQCKAQIVQVDDNFVLISNEGPDFNLDNFVTLLHGHAMWINIGIIVYIDPNVAP